ncbi:MAG: hypothetical protein K9N55_16000 [Phycisphaerae bacterium]|nr:hypothetical protein [Phycisphaerae bacterium]
MKRAKQAQKHSVVWASLVFMCTSLAWSQNQSSTQFPLTPVDVVTLTGQAKMNLMMGATVLCQNAPNKAVNAQAKTKGLTPLHGELRLGGNPMNPSEGIPIYFTLDQSQSGNKGFDTLFIDQNGDLDLTNEKSVGVDTHFSKEDLPRLGQEDSTVFMPFTLRANGITETLRLTLLPISKTMTMAMVTPTMARQGHIKVGNKEHDIILGQTNAVSGRYDHVWTACFMDGQRNGDTGLLADWPTVDGTLYQLTSNKDGTLLTVQPYAGKFGTLKLTSMSKAKVSAGHSGLLLSRTNLVNLASSKKKDGISQIPEGDYMPASLMATVGDTSLILSFKSTPDKTDLDPYCVRIRDNDSPSLTMPAFKDVAFTWPNPNKTFHPGDQVTISASLCDKTTGLAVAGITKDGQAMPPTAAILGPDGKVVAEGQMPFG